MLRRDPPQKMDWASGPATHLSPTFLFIISLVFSPILPPHPNEILLSFKFYFAAQFVGVALTMIAVVALSQPDFWTLVGRFFHILPPARKEEEEEEVMGKDEEAAAHAEAEAGDAVVISDVV